jgi:hypothetical protein
MTGLNSYVFAKKSINSFGFLVKIPNHLKKCHFSGSRNPVNSTTSGYRIKSGMMVLGLSPCPNLVNGLKDSYEYFGN